jgi:hypothetical protein
MIDWLIDIILNIKGLQECGFIINDEASFMTIIFFMFAYFSWSPLSSLVICYSTQNSS